MKQINMDLAQRGGPTEEECDRYAKKAGSLQEAVYFCAVASPMEFGEIAYAMNIEYKNFMRKIDPNDEATFGVHLLERYMEVCGNDIPKRFLNHKPKSDDELFVERVEMVANALPTLLEAVVWLKQHQQEKKEKPDLKAV